MNVLCRILGPGRENSTEVLTSRLTNQEVGCTKIIESCVCSLNWAFDANRLSSTGQTYFG